MPPGCVWTNWKSNWAAMKEEIHRMKAHWQNEKDLIQAIRSIKEEQEKLGIEAEQAERQGDLAKVAEIRYGRVNELHGKLEEANRRLADLQSESKMLKEEVDDEDIAEVVSRWTGIPVSRMLEGEKEKLVHMEARIGRRVIGQEEAVAAVSNAVRRARSGLQDPNRPIGSFIFMGPTGVGKTELAKALAEFIFDSDQAMTRIDMSEYHGKTRRGQAHRRAPRATWGTRRGAISPRRSDGGRIPWCCLTKSRKPIPRSSTCCFRSWTTVA